MCDKFLLALSLGVMSCGAFEAPQQPVRQQGNVVRYTREQMLAVRNNPTPPPNIPVEIQRPIPDNEG